MVVVTTAPSLRASGGCCGALSGPKAFEEPPAPPLCEPRRPALARPRSPGAKPLSACGSGSPPASPGGSATGGVSPSSLWSPYAFHGTEAELRTFLAESLAPLVDLQREARCGAPVEWCEQLTRVPTFPFPFAFHSSLPTPTTHRTRRSRHRDLRCVF